MVIRPVSRIIAGGMLRQGTPLEDRRAEHGFWLKREDKACVPPGPPFSKARGVYARIASLTNERLIGVLDTYHSQAGHAVARACQVLGKACVNYYPNFKYEPGPRAPQRAAEGLGAELVALTAGRSSILFHQAKRLTEERGGYMMPNALKLHESVKETATEARLAHSMRGPFDLVVIPASSATIAAGVVCGLGKGPLYIIHLGYSRSEDETRAYVCNASGVRDARLIVIDEDYAYKDTAKEGSTPDWPCNPYYDLKAFRWWKRKGSGSYRYSNALFWNIG